MRVSIKKPKTPKQLHQETKALAHRFVDLTVNEGLSESQAVESLRDSPLSPLNEAVQVEVRRLLALQDLNNEQLNRLVTAKTTEIMLTGKRQSDQLKAAQILTTKKELGWAPSEKISINVSLMNQNQELLAEVFNSIEDYMPKGEIIDAEFSSSEETDE